MGRCSVLAAAAVLGGVCATLGGCAEAVVGVRREAHPPDPQFVVTAKLDTWPRGYYSVSVTIRNLSGAPIALAPAMFRLESAPPTTFVPAGRMPLFLGKSGWQLPDQVEPRGSAEGEIFFGIRGTPLPVGLVRFVARLPDGEHSFDFKLVG